LKFLFHHSKKAKVSRKNEKTIFHNQKNESHRNLKSEVCVRLSFLGLQNSQNFDSFQKQKFPKCSELKLQEVLLSESARKLQEFPTTPKYCHRLKSVVFNSNTTNHINSCTLNQLRKASKTKKGENANPKNKNRRS